MLNCGIVISEERRRRPLRLATGCVEALSVSIVIPIFFLFSPTAKTTAHKRKYHKEILQNIMLRILHKLSI
jgi:hypothetical protein